MCFFSATAQTMIESESRAVFAETTAELSLVIESKEKRNEQRLQTEFLAPDGKIIASSAQDLRIDVGKKTYKIRIPIGSLMSEAGENISWYRMRYRLANSEGIVSVSELLSDDFELRASAFARVVPGESMMVRVRALNPFTEKAVKDVIVNVAVEIDLTSDSDDDKLKLQATSRTNGNGIATLEFKIPEGVKPDGDGEIKITGQKNGVVRKIDEDLDDQTLRGSVYLTTDKPLYQPGQTFNIRALYFDSNNTVVTDSELEFSIEDAEDTVVFKQKVNTSDFGIAAISWPIPENAKLGSYRVRIEAGEDLSESTLDFKVSRYELPNFAVVAKPDKTFYLPADTTARITVNADYLFGKPVTKGNIRVVARGERNWNSSKRQYDFEEGEVIEGATDDDGKFVAEIDLKDEFRELLGSEWRRFEDQSFTAYFTDLSTNRTEQRRFDIRLTKEPIHLYLVRYAYAHRDMPITGYVSAFYADGTPAVCNIEISDRERVVAKLKSNSLGAGKFELSIPKERRKNDEYEISIKARDKQGQIGSFEETYRFSEEDALQISTDRIIYNSGDMIEVELFSTRKNGFVFLDVTKDWMPLETRLVKLSNGGARLSIPYKPSFKGDLNITAYGDRESERYSGAMTAGRGVIFPERQNLILGASFSKKEYKPGEDASLKFSVTDGSRRPVASAIGLGIFDKAIEERARTDAEFGGYFGQFSRLLGYEKSFGNLTVKDLNELDPSRPVKPEIELAAEIMLAGNWYWPSIYRSGDLRGEAKMLYSESVAKQLDPVKISLNQRHAKDGDHPIDVGSLSRILADNGIRFDQTRDPWGTPYVVEFSVEKTQNIVTVKTLGPDKKNGTPDDFVAMTAGFQYFSRIGEKIDSTHLRYRSSTEGYIQDKETLAREIARDDVDIASLKDRWGRDYVLNFEVSGRNYVTRISSLGPNGISDPQTWRTDDFDVWKTSTDYFADTDKEINRILNDEVNLKKKPFPRSEKEFSEMLAKNGLA
ncbi:MAG: MG2 domain-containing protein, partial [Pyrinomonadaceae bacterium]